MRHIKPILRSRVLQVLFLFCQSAALIAQEPAQESQVVEIEVDHMATGISKSPKRSSDFTNWMFAAAAVLTATVGMIVVSLSPGKSVPPADQPL